MGARISGHGSTTLEIEGVESLSGFDYTVLPDRIEAGTFLTDVAMTGGRARALNADAGTLVSVLDQLDDAGGHINKGLVCIETEGASHREQAAYVTQMH